MGNSAHPNKRRDQILCKERKMKGQESTVNPYTTSVIDCLKGG